MFGGGFFGGFGGPDMPSRSREVNNKRYYECLGVDPSSSDAEIKKAHRKLALIHHPDKGGDSEKFKEINEAYDVLRDPEKRKIYDQYGEDAVKDGAGGGMGGMGGMADIFDIFGGQMRGRPRERKGEDVVHKLKVSLEEMYTGNVRKLHLTRNIKCDSCGATGSKTGRKDQCPICHGSGVQVLMRPLGPGMMQQIQQPCSRCNHTGYIIPESDKCSKCMGKGLVPEKKGFEVHIEKGHRAQQKIVLRGEAGCSDPDMLPGDVIFLLEQKEHKDFKRVGHDLIMTKTVTLLEALTGTCFHIKHLDDRVLKVQTPPGHVIKPDSWECIKEEGMPVHGRPYYKGNLYINFSVEFPDTLTAPQMSSLKQILPPPKRMENGSMDVDEPEDVELKPVNDITDELKRRRDEMRAFGAGDSALDSDSDDEGHGRPRVQCAQQ